jgi:hypothetical protein
VSIEVELVVIVVEEEGLDALELNNASVSNSNPIGNNFSIIPCGDFAFIYFHCGCHASNHASNHQCQDDSEKNPKCGRRDPAYSPFGVYLEVGPLIT